MRAKQNDAGASGALLIDTHAHLDFSQFDGDRDEVIARAASEGVATVIGVGFDLSSSRRTVELSRKYADVWACVGVHPHEASQVDAAVLNSLRELSSHDKVVAIGEIGLDYYRNRSPRDVQRRVFTMELELAAEVGKPVVIHDREAHGDVMDIIHAWAGTIPSSGNGFKAPLGVVHCFSGDLAMADELFQLGFYVSLAGPVTFPNARRLHELVRGLPLDRLLLETDAPFLSPHPHRGKRNEPAYVKLIASKIADIKQMSLQEVCRITTENACRVFRLR